jgi:hypothetical protein
LRDKFKPDNIFTRHWQASYNPVKRSGRTRFCQRQTLRQSLVDRKCCDQEYDRQYKNHPVAPAQRNQANQ